MGSGSSISSEKAVTVKEEFEPDSVDEEINVAKLFSALFKLKCTFEVNDSLATSLIATICNPELDMFDTRFTAVEKWIAKHSDVTLTEDEITAVVKFVKLYEPPNSFEIYKSSAGLTDDQSPTTTVKETSTVGGEGEQCCLWCPYASKLASWTAEIRHKELTKMSSMYTSPNSTMRMGEHDNQDEEGGDTWRSASRTSSKYSSKSRTTSQSSGD